MRNDAESSVKQASKQASKAKSEDEGDSGPASASCAETTVLVLSQVKFRS